jgi:glycosyltransferase involved in cell wall biosynthesis
MVGAGRPSTTYEGGDNESPRASAEAGPALAAADDAPVGIRQDGLTDIAATRPRPAIRPAELAAPIRERHAAAAPDLSRVKVAVVHEWFDTYAGSERVVEQILHCFPQAAVFAIVDFMPAGQRSFLAGRAVTTSFIQRLPLARRHFRSYLGLMPLAVEQFDLSGFDLVISSSHAVAKGVITGPDQVHISYVHSPMRYAWDLQHQYLRLAAIDRGVKTILARWLLSRLRQWDVRTAPGVDVFIANSSYIARRIRKTYGRAAAVIHPPVDIDQFACVADKQDHYVAVSRQVPYKRVDIIAAAFAAMPHRRLTIVGDGPEHARVAAAAANAPNITLRGPMGHDQLVRLMQSARALVVAAEEDFGITIVEAQACGTPVIAFGRGGASDIVVADGRGAPTGVLFDAQSPDAIIDAVDRLERLAPAIAPEACRANAARFSVGAFRTRLRHLAATALADRGLEIGGAIERFDAAALAGPDSLNGIARYH